MQNYFSLLGLPESFDVNLPDLEKAYFAAQRRFHPDRLVGKNASEREAAIGQSMLVNDAYEALKNPLKRARHLLALAGILPDSVKPLQELLMEILERRESLSESTNAAEAERLAQENAAARNQTLDGLLQAFTDSDINMAAHLTHRLSYLMKLDDEISLRRKMLA